MTPAPGGDDIINVMTPRISHSMSEETPEAKARWFGSLSMQERMEIFDEIVEMALTRNPQLAEKGVPQNAQPASGGVRLLRIP